MKRKLQKPQKGMWKRIQDWDENLLRFELQKWTRLCSYFWCHVQNIGMMNCFVDSPSISREDGFYKDFLNVQKVLYAYHDRFLKERLEPLCSEWKRRGFSLLSKNEDYWVATKKTWVKTVCGNSFPQGGTGDVGDPKENLMLNDYLREVREQNQAFGFSFTHDSSYSGKEEIYLRQYDKKTGNYCADPIVVTKDAIKAVCNYLISSFDCDEEFSFEGFKVKVSIDWEWCKKNENCSK